MKKILIIILAIGVTFASKAQFTSANLTAAGLTCAMCTRAIYKELQKIPFVDKVDADINNSAFVIQFKKQASVDPDALKKAVESAGFSVSRLLLSGSFSNVSVGKDAHLMLSGHTFHFLNGEGKSLNGNQSLTVVDKNFVSAKEFRKIKLSSDHPCVETGKAEQCCVKSGVTPSSRIYHVTI